MRGAELRAALLDAAAATAHPSSDDEFGGAPTAEPVPAAREAAVLIAVQPDGRVWLTRRSSALLHHPGQIALPGGKLEVTDVDAEAGALREAEEEIGLPPTSVEVLGRLAPHITVTGFTVTPILGWIGGCFSPRAEAGEVEEVFSVPFAHLADTAHYELDWREWGGGRRYYYAVPYGDYYIWGATARILRGLAERLPVR